MNYHKIEKTSIANGEGVRVVLWVSGCSLHCKGCHNPETWSYNSGKLFDDIAKNELFEALSKSYIQGITFSGGHPLEQNNRATLYCLIQEIRKKFPDKDIWLYTGYIWEDIFKKDVREIQRMLCFIDVLVDGPYIEELKDITLRWRGSSNQRVIDVKKSLQQDKVVLWNPKD